MTETKQYKDYLLTPYMDGIVDDLPLKSGHERYLTYMPKTSEGHLTEGAKASRRAYRSDHDGVTIEQSFKSKDCSMSHQQLLSMVSGTQVYGRRRCEVHHQCTRQR